MIKVILVRYGIPSVLAIVIIAYFGVPFVNQLLTRWFRDDVELRAQLVANTISEPLSQLVDKHDTAALRSYLSKLTTNERLLAVLLCREDGTLIVKTDATPPAVTCHISTAPNTDDKRNSITMQLTSGSVAISQFDIDQNAETPFRILLVHDLSYIDRRQSAARNYVFAAVGVFVSMLALLVGFISWLLIRKWVNLLVGDIRGLRFLDDADSHLVAQPILRQVREVLREVEYNQRLEIDFKGLTPHSGYRRTAT